MSTLHQPKSLAAYVVSGLEESICSGTWRVGERLPTESQLMKSFAVSRSVVREAISHLQAAGHVHTRHGIGSFVAEQHEWPGFRINPHDLATLQDVLDVLELRIAVEVGAAAYAAERRTPDQLAAMHAALHDFMTAARQGRETVEADCRLHLAIAHATHNRHVIDLLTSFGTSMIPRSRLPGGTDMDPKRQTYLLHIAAEHEDIVAAIEWGQAEQARAAMYLHLSKGLQRRRASLLVTAESQLPVRGLQALPVRDGLHNPRRSES